MTFTVHPTPGTEIQSEEFAEHLKKILAMLDRVHTGFSFLSPTGLNASLGEGKAYIAGYEVGESGDGSEPMTFASSTSNQGVYLDEDGNVTVDTVAPGGVSSLKLWEVDTNATDITDFRDVRSYVCAFQAMVQGDSFEATGVDAFLKGFRLNLKGTEPYFDLYDTSGGSATITRIRAEGGALNVYDVDTGTLSETFIVNLRGLGSLPFIPLSEKGAAGGVATLDGGGLIPAAQLPAATDAVKGAATLSNAAPATIGAANVQGASTRVARQDHTHAHGDRGADGGTSHAFTQISGVITDAQHGTRSGGTQHALATGGAHGFMSSTDKAKLDASTSTATPSTLVSRDGDGRTKFAAAAAAGDAIIHGQPAGGDLTGTYPNPTIGAAKVTESKLADNAATFAKIQDIATDRLIGRDTAGSGNPEEIAVSGGLEFNGSAAIRRSALTGDVTAPAGSNATTIPNNTITNAKAADMAARTVKGKPTSGSGDPSDIPIGADEVLGRSGSDDIAGQAVATAATADTIVKRTGTGTIKAADGVAPDDVANVGQLTDVQVFTEDGTWTKSANAKWVEVIVIGAGGPGGSAGGTGRRGGGGGGARIVRRFPAAALGATVAVTVGTSVLGSAGGNSSFGAHIVAGGGGKGADSSGTTRGAGGGGGGSIAAGGDGSTGGGGGAGGGISAEKGGDGGPATGTPGGGDGGNSLYGGGGGSGAPSTGNGQLGGSSVTGGGGGGGSGDAGGAGGASNSLTAGGGGGGGSPDGSPGTSRSGTGKAGDGGGGGSSGTGGTGGVPGGGGGGGGTGGVGGRGEVIVTTWFGA